MAPVGPKKPCISEVHDPGGTELSSLPHVSTRSRDAAQGVLTFLREAGSRPTPTEATTHPVLIPHEAPGGSGLYPRAPRRRRVGTPCSRSESLRSPLRPQAPRPACRAGGAVRVPSLPRRSAAKGGLCCLARREIDHRARWFAAYDGNRSSARYRLQRGSSPRFAPRSPPCWGRGRPRASQIDRAPRNSASARQQTQQAFLSGCGRTAARPRAALPSSSARRRRRRMRARRRRSGGRDRRGSSTPATRARC